jgi:anaerobic ribonucleoside-triphosphate reductase activating protein
MKSIQEWPDQPEKLILFRLSMKCTVLGPGTRAVLWVQGCPFTCPGCVVPESLPFSDGMTYRVEALADLIVANQDIDGVTFSGGEPMSQAAGLCHLIDRVRAVRDLSFMSYSGFTLENLHTLNAGWRLSPEPTRVTVSLNGSSDHSRVLRIAASPA